MSKLLSAGILAIVFAGVAQSSLAADSTVTRQQELEFLRQAAAGRTDNVFFMQIFAGRVVFPRTFTLARMGRSKYGVSLGAEPRGGNSRGFVLFGRIEVIGGVRQDADTHARLPAAPRSSRHVGEIVVEEYDEGQFALEASAFVTDENDYLWFMGEAVPYVTDVLNAYAALSNASAPSTVASPTELAGDSPNSCLGARRARTTRIRQRCTRRPQIIPAR